MLGADLWNWVVNFTSPSLPALGFILILARRGGRAVDANKDNVEPPRRARGGFFVLRNGHDHCHQAGQ
jgi:hypothetical protein